MLRDHAKYLGLGFVIMLLFTDQALSPLYGTLLDSSLNISFDPYPSFYPYMFFSKNGSAIYPRKQISSKFQIKIG